MKRYRIIIYIVIVTSGSMWGCKNFLETEPKDFLSPEFYFENEEQVQAALVGIYNCMSSTQNGNVMYAGRYTFAMGTEGDDGFYRKGPERNVVGHYLYTASTPDLSNFWRMMYRGINQANLLLENIDEADMDDVKKEVIRGETLFLRGYYYFMLVSYFGDVPLILESTTSPTENQIARTPSPDVYQQITDDMEQAYNLVRSIADIEHSGRVNKSAVAGVLARVYLYWAGNPLRDESKYEDVKNWAAKVMDPEEVGIEHRLNPSYQQVFINQAQDIYDIEESLWEVEFYGNRTDRPRQAGTLGNYIGIRSSNSEVGNSNANVLASSRLYLLYEEEDERRDWCIAPFQYSPVSSTNKQEYTTTAIWSRDAGKYRREYETFLPKSTGYTPINFPLLRYADVLLMFAEAENQINGPTEAAIEAFNQVRARAKASLLEHASIPANKTEFLYLIQDERSRELCFEGLRRNDLIRWDIYLSSMKTFAASYESSSAAGAAAKRVVSHFKNIAPKHLLWPIPTRELMLNRELTQNPGW